MPDDHSEVVPLLPIPNRTVKRLCADDSADSRVKVGHRQAIYVRRGARWAPLLYLGVHRMPQFVPVCRAPPRTSSRHKNRRQRTLLSAYGRNGCQVPDRQQQCRAFGRVARMHHVREGRPSALGTNHGITLCAVQPFFEVP